MKEELIKDIALVLLFVLSSWAKDWMTKRKEKREAVQKSLAEKQKEEAGIDDDLKVSGEIYEKLTDLLFTYDAVRAFIKQFHNGSSFYSGQKIQRQTVSHEKCRPGIAKIKPYHDGILIPLEVHGVLDYMDKHNLNAYWCGDAENIKKPEEKFYCEEATVIKFSKPELWQWMEDFGAKSLLYIKISDTKTSNTIGLLGINFNYRHALNEKQIKTIEATTKREFERIFDKL
jgi:hypothetical protein